MSEVPEIAPYVEPKPGEYLVIGSVSGGKDSTAMALHLKELGHDYKLVFADTGWEDEKTYDYVRNVLPKVLGPIEWVRTEIELDDEREQIALEFEERLGFYSPMVRSCLRKRIFPSRMVRWCTFNLKVDPLKRYMRAMDEKIINAVGIRAEESVSRAKMPMREPQPSFKCDVWRPLLHWSLDDVIAIHHRHGIRPNPKYLEGSERVGCWPCIYARKSEIRQFAFDEKRVQILSDLEKAVTAIQNADREAKGKDPIPPNGWFQSRNGFITDETGRRWKDGLRWPIEKVIDWSRTSRGGKQVELFATVAAESGCVRWGLCEAAKDPSEDKL